MYTFRNARRSFMTNAKYYIRFTDRYPYGAIKNVIKSLQHKKDVFMKYLQSNEKILFIRYEEPMSNDIIKLGPLGDSRIIYPAFRSYYAKNELYHLEQLSTYLQTTYPGLNFHIMFIGNSMNTTVDLDYNNKTKIITIPNQSFNIENYTGIMDEIFLRYGQFITDSLMTDVEIIGSTNDTSPINILLPPVLNEA